MAHFHIEGLPPYDGDHEITFDDLTNREFHLIKQLSGVRAAEVEDAFGAGDNDLLVAFLIIALQRKGLRVDHDRIWDAKAGTIQFVGEEKEPEQGPPSQTPSEPGAHGSDSALSEASGQPSSNGGDNPASVPSPTGVLT